MQPKVKFLTVVWGENYIERFCALALPSFLAPGNLPALAESTDLEVVIMTRSTEFAHFEKNLTFKRLSKLCAIRFVAIDDLISTAVYGVTLTLAYARPIIACGEDMLNTHFVFMNADFVLANGSLRSLIRHIHAGRSIVLGPSYRAIAEELEPALEKKVDLEQGILDIPSRELVGMALRHPHRTTIAKTYNQQAFSSSHPNQLFWQVDENTVLARYFLIFMLCIKPERVINSINCFCDYALIPELCPSGDEVAMDDSDDFFMLELQSRMQETSMLKQGQMSPGKIANSLQAWATVVHRRTASYDIIFHSKDIPPQTDGIKALAAQTVAEIRQHLRKPKPHQNHFYWVMGVEAWKEYRRKQGLSSHAPEIAPYQLGLAARYYLGKHQLRISLNQLRMSLNQLRFSLKQMRRSMKAWAESALQTPGPRYLWRQLGYFRYFVLRGLRPNSQGSVYWQGTALRRQLVENFFSNSVSRDSLLIIGHPSEIRLLGNLPDWVDVTSVAELTKRGIVELARYDKIMFFPDIRSHTLSTILPLFVKSLNPSGSLYLFFQSAGNNAEFPRLAEIIFELGEMAGNRLNSLTVRSVGGRLLHLSNRLNLAACLKLQRFSRSYQFLVSPILAPVSYLSAVIAYIANKFAIPGGKDRLVEHCFGIWIQVKMVGTLENGTADETRSAPGVKSVDLLHVGS